ncbi:PLP-dependent aminotransferase family protein [Kurthia gibsonii]|uniref:PLP-dependent aminotransferase family protein n=1 Tax=Kurthia gibsonii TaxID=33946 RepID=UPI0034CDA3DA
MNVFKFPINNFSPIDEQIYIHLKNIIRNKEFEDIKIFPTPRDLAIQIKQSYSDVMSAYRQLEVEGYLKKQDDIFIVPHFERVDKEHSSGYKSDYVIDEEVAIFDFSPTTVDKQYFPLSRWQECLLESSNLSSLFQFSHHDGEYLLREAICTHLKKNRNIEASPANIFISSNVPALLLQLGTFLKKGGYYNSFKIENPGNYEAFSIFKELDYHLSTCPVSLEDGHDVNSLKDERTLFYVTLSYQQPLGYNLPIEKRAKLHQWAKKNDCLFIEDDRETAFRYDVRNVYPMASVDSTHVIYINSFAYSFLPSAKVAYMVLPNKLIEKYTQFTKHLTQNSSPILQTAIGHFINKGYFLEHVEHMKQIYNQKMQVLTAKIQTTFPERARIFGEEAGQSLLLQLNNGMSEEELIQSALEIGVKVYPISPYYLEGQTPKTPTLILGFGQLTRNEMTDAINRLYIKWYT